MEVFSKKPFNFKTKSYSYDDFIQKIFHQIILSLFFGAMIILSFYTIYQSFYDKRY